MADWSVQRYWEDVTEGEAMPTVTINIPIQRMVMLAGSNRDFAPIHHNTHMAQRQNAPDMFLNNISVLSFWERAVHEYIGLQGKVKKVGPFRIRIFNTTGETILLKGTVKRKWQENGEKLIELEVWSEHSKGVSSGPGPVIASLPSRT